MSEEMQQALSTTHLFTPSQAQDQPESGILEDILRYFCRFCAQVLLESDWILIQLQPWTPNRKW